MAYRYLSVGTFSVAWLVQMKTCCAIAHVAETSELCMLIVVDSLTSSQEWEFAIKHSWATDLTFFMLMEASDGQPQPSLSTPAEKHQHHSEGEMGRTARSNRSEAQLIRLATSGTPPDWGHAIFMWAWLGALLSRTSNSTFPSSWASPREFGATAKALTSLTSRCAWFMHVDYANYVNVHRLTERLQCLRDWQALPQYFAMAPLMSEDRRIVLADEVGGYILGRRLLLHLAGSNWAESCLSDLRETDDGLGFGWERRPGFFVSLCLWVSHRLTPYRLGDPMQDVLVSADPTFTGVARLRALQPSGHCAVIVPCTRPIEMAQVHRTFTNKRSIVNVGCIFKSLADQQSVEPAWAPRVARALEQCPVRRALRSEPEQPMALGAFLNELRRPSKPSAELMSRLQAGGAKGLCILVPVTDASSKQVQRAESVVASWAAPYLLGSPARRQRGAREPVVILYSRRPLFSGWENFTLSLPGDLDMRHPKFNALRFVYLWLAVATHLTDRCLFFMKADTDAYIDVPGLRRALQAFNASERVYAGKVTYSHGEGYSKWGTFAHGLGYVLSRGALRASRWALYDCMLSVLRHRLESIEDMTLGACLRPIGLFPQELGHVVFDFRGDLDRVLALPEAPLLVHPVEAVDMQRMHVALS